MEEESRERVESNRFMRGALLVGMLNGLVLAAGVNLVHGLRGNIRGRIQKLLGYTKRDETYARD